MSFKVKVDHWDCAAVGGHTVTNKPAALATLFVGFLTYYLLWFPKG